MSKVRGPRVIAAKWFGPMGDQAFARGCLILEPNYFIAVTSVVQIHSHSTHFGSDAPALYRFHLVEYEYTQVLVK